MSEPQLFTSKSKLIASICKEDFWGFVTEFWEEVPGAGILIPNWHMKVLAEELQKCAERVFRNQTKQYDVVFNVSPGTSKSSVGSILFPAWVWTRMPSARILCASHTSELVLDLAYKSREVIRSDKYKECFPEVLVRQDKEGISLFRNTAGGDRLSCTVGGKTPTGFHAHFLILDDLSDPQRMLSEAERAAAADFLTNIVPTRKVDKSVSVTFLIMQRLGAGDPTDVMLEVSNREGSDAVRQICLPAELTEDVKPYELRDNYVDGLMDPVRLPLHVLNGFKARSSFTYATQFLQQKMIRGGGMFKEEYFLHRVKAAPRNCQRIRAWDRAATGDSGCYSAGVLIAVDSDSNFYIEHVVKGQWEPTQRNKKILSTAHRDRLKYGPKYEPTIVIEMERGSTGLESYQNIVKVLKGFRVKEDKPTGSKDVRAEPLSTQFAAGNVYLVEDGTWSINEYIEEFLLFKPNPGKRLGQYKDQVDATCLLGGTLISTSHGLKRIEDVKVGDKVRTRFGYNTVKWAGESGRVSELVSVLFDNSTYITGTREHRVWTENRGFVPLELITPDDIVLVDDGVIACHSENVTSVIRNSLQGTLKPNAVLSSVPVRKDGKHEEESTNTRRYITKGLGIIDNSQTENITGEEESPYTGLYGRIKRVTSPLIMISTIKTGTHSITTSVIWSALHDKNIPTDILIEEDSRDKKSILIEREKKLRNGTGRRREESGIANTERELGREEKKRNTLVFNVRVNSPHVVRDVREVLDQSIVLSHVVIEQHTPEGITRTLTRFVKLVERNLREQRNLLSAQDHVVLGGSGTKVPVYDIEVEETHEFFANGILVHNSMGFNLLSAWKVPATFRIYHLRGEKDRTQKLVVCSKNELGYLAIDKVHKVIMVRLLPFGDNIVQEEVDRPESLEGEYDFVIGELMSKLDISIADIDPDDYQDRWEELIPEYDKKPEEIVMTRSIGKKLWSFLLRKRQPFPDTFVFCDSEIDCRRALSMAYAVSDIMGLKRDKCIHYLADTEMTHDKVPPPNQHVYAVTKISRNTVV